MQTLKIKVWCLIASAKSQKDFIIQLWWATIRHCIQMSLCYPSCEWYITCPFLVVCRAWELLLWLWWFLKYIVVFKSRNNMVGRFFIRHFCGGLLDGKMTARLKIYFLYGWSTECVRGLWQREGYVEKRVWTRNVR